MAVLLTNKIELSGLGYNFSIDLHMPIVALMGNSGIGKTVMWKIIARKKEKLSLGVPTVVTNYSQSENDITVLLKGTYKSLFVIDNADIRITKPSTVDLLYSCDNQIILLGRNIPFYRLGPSSCGMMYNDNGTIRVKYQRSRNGV